MLRGTLERRQHRTLAMPDDTLFIGYLFLLSLYLCIYNTSFYVYIGTYGIYCAYFGLLCITDL